jgi:hypothetical protein
MFYGHQHVLVRSLRWPGGLLCVRRVGGDTPARELLERLTQYDAAIVAFERATIVAEGGARPADPHRY